MSLDLPVSPSFGGGSLPCSLSSLRGPRIVINLQSLLLHLAVTMGVLKLKLILFLSFFTLI